MDKTFNTYVGWSGPHISRGQGEFRVDYFNDTYGKIGVGTTLQDFQLLDTRWTDPMNSAIENKIKYLANKNI